MQEKKMDLTQLVDEAAVEGGRSEMEMGNDGWCVISNRRQPREDIRAVGQGANSTVGIARQVRAGSWVNHPHVIPAYDGKKSQKRVKEPQEAARCRERSSDSRGSAGMMGWGPAY
jgi:hypothetical protein